MLSIYGWTWAAMPGTWKQEIVFVAVRGSLLVGMIEIDHSLVLANGTSVHHETLYCRSERSRGLLAKISYHRIRAQVKLSRATCYSSAILSSTKEKAKMSPLWKR